MALSRFPAKADVLTASIIEALSRLKAIKDGSGDLTTIMLSQAADALVKSKINAVEMLAESQKQPNAASAHMASLGGPNSLAAFSAALSDIDAKAQAYNDMLASFFAAHPGGIEMVTTTVNGEQVRILRMALAIPGADAAAIRGSTELANLVAAISSVAD